MPPSRATRRRRSSSAGRTRRARSASPPCTPASSCAPRSTPRRSSTASSPPRRRSPIRPVRPGRSEGLAALSAVLLALSFPKFGHGLVAWVALTPLLVALAEAASPAHGFRLGYITGALSSLGIVYWTAIVVVQYGDQSLPVGVAVVCLL